MESTPEETWKVGPGVAESAWRYRWVVAASCLAGVLLGYLVASQQQTLYQAESRILLTDPASAGIFGDGARDVDTARYVRNQAAQIESAPVQARALELLEQSELPAGAEITAVALAEETDSVVVQVRHPNAAGAAATAEAVVDAYDELGAEAVAQGADRAVAQLTPAAEDLEEQLAVLQEELAEDPENPLIDSQLRNTSDRLTELRRQIQAVEIEAALFGSGIRRLEAAEVPGTPVEPQPARAAALGGIIGAALAAAWAWRANSRRQDIEDLAPGIFGVPVIGRVPEFDPDIRTKVLHRRHAERQLGKAWSASLPGPYHVIFTSVTLSLRSVEGNVVIVTSMTPGEGKTLTSLNLAAAAARSGKKVLLLDTDVHRSDIDRVVPQIGSSCTLADFMDDSTALRNVAALHLPDTSQVAVMQVGPVAPRGASIFRNEPFRAGVRQLAEEFDLVVIDSAPIVPVIDTIEVSESADGLVIVVTPQTSRAVLVDGKERLSHATTPILGIIVNRSETDQAESAYGYGYERSADVVSTTSATQDTVQEAPQPDSIPGEPSEQGTAR